MCRKDVVAAASRPLMFTTLNVHLLNNQTDIINQLLHDTGTGVLCLTETWHENSNATCICRLRSQGWQVIETARPIPLSTTTDSLHFINHEGVALVASTRIKVERLKPATEPTTFELSSQGASCVLAVLYRPGSTQITQSFYDELESLLDVLSTISTLCAITGDLNVRLDRPDDPPCRTVSLR